MAVAKTKKKSKGSPVKGMIVTLVLIALVVGYYYYLSNREKGPKEEVVHLTVAQELISRNLTYNYPPTPKEVLRYYSEITQCFYNEDYSNEELELLAEKTRELYDSELVAKNDWQQYLVNLNLDIQNYRDQNITIAAFNLPASTDVDFYTVNGDEVARMYCSYILQKGNNKQTVEQIYVMRKDEEGHWRILGWDLAENVKLEE